MAGFEPGWPAAAFTFAANLTRGLYAIEVNVLDEDRHRFLAVARGIRHFHVVETVTYDGVANLFLRGREITADVVHNAPPALAR